MFLGSLSMLGGGFVDAWQVSDGAAVAHLVAHRAHRDHGEAFGSDASARDELNFTLNAALFYDLGEWSLGLHLENLTEEETFTRGFGSTSVIPTPRPTHSTS